LQAHRVNTMRYRAITMLATMALALTGCGQGWTTGKGLNWKWSREKETPVTQPLIAPNEQVAAESGPDAVDAATRRVSDEQSEMGPGQAYTGHYLAGTSTDAVAVPAQWPSAGRPVAMAVHQLESKPTPAEQTPPVPALAVLAPPSVRKPPSAPQATDRRPVANTLTQSSDIEQVMAAAIAGQPTSGRSRSNNRRPGLLSKVDSAPVAAPAAVTTEKNMERRSAPPVETVAQVSAGRRGEIEYPSQMPQAPPPQSVDPTDLAALPGDSNTEEPVASAPGLTEQTRDDTDDVDGAPDLPDLDLHEEVAPAARAANRVRQGTTELVAASMVQVNDKFITVDNVLNGLYNQLSSMQQVENEEAFRRAVAPLIEQQLRQLIYESLVLAEAEANLTDQQKAAIESEVADARREMIAHAGGSVQALEQYYRQRHTTLEKVLDEHRNRLTGQMYLQSKIEPGITITRDMLLDYYRQHEKDFVIQEKVQMQIIAAPFDEFLPETNGKEPTPQEWKLARQRARDVIDAAAEAVMAGNDFGEVAKKYSRGFRASSGGIWPAMAKGSFRETEVERNAFALGEGDICGIIETETGYYIVKTLKVDPGQYMSFEKAQRQIEDILRRQQYDKLAGDYFMKLFSEATIAQSDEFMEMAINGAVDRHWYGD